jgi:outer membrane protein insertion porin family
MRGVFIAAGILAAGAAAWAAEPAGAPVVREVVVRFSGPGRTDEGYVLSHVGSRAGAELDRQRLARDVKALLATGRFTDADAAVEPVGKEVRLLFTLRQKPRLGRDPEVTGVKWFQRRHARKILELKEGDYADEDDLATRAKRLEADYREKFRPSVRVTWKTEVVDADEGLTRVTFAVEEGARERVRKVHFSGNPSIPSKTLWKAVEPRKIWNPMRWFKKRRFDADELEDARVAVLDVYLDAGYLDAEVDLPEPQRDAEGRLAVTFAVREGRRYTFGDVGIGGIAKFPEADVSKLIRAKKGETASAAAIRKTVEDIEDFYGSRGYIDATAKPALDADPDRGVLGVRFEVTEGVLVHVRNVRVQGNTRTRDKVIRREILVYPGDVYDSRKAKRSERILNNLGFFSHARTYPLDTEDPGQRDLVIDVEEKRTGQFMVGAGYSSVDEIIGFAELSQGNFDLAAWPYFMGAGQKLNVRAEYGQRRKSYELSFVEPWFLDRRLSLGFDLYRTEVDYPDYDVQRTGGAVSLGKALPWATRANLRYRLERVRTTGQSDTNRYVYYDPPYDAYDLLQNEDRMESTLSLTLTHDTRNNPLVATRGLRASVFGELSGGPLGFDTDIYQVGAQASQYIPLWWKHVLSLRARYEVVEPYGDTEEVPLADRLFLGGGHTLRGFQWRDVGPKAVPAGGPEGAYKSVGGRTLAMASAEYTVPIVEILRLACFYDIGNVWRDAYATDFTPLASSAGVGIRVDIPGFPIRVDRAWVIEKDRPITKEDPWVVWIGYDF